LNNSRIIILKGPTASGKTDLATKLYDKHPLEIISVDSVMVYRGLNIGSAKPDPKDLKLYPHHLIDIREPTESYSVGEFHKDVKGLIESIIKKGKTPILVGGTMMYFRVLQQGLSKLPSANQKIRHQIDVEATEKGWLNLHKELQMIDPKSAQRIKPSDKQRIQRAIEVYRITGKTISSFHQEQKQPLNYQCLDISLFPNDRASLHKRIEERFNAMLKKGLISEVENLLSIDLLTSSHQSMKSVGYKQICEFIENKCSLEEAKSNAIFASRRLAKKQLTWLRSKQKSFFVDCFDPQFANIIEDKVSQFLV